MVDGTTSKDKREAFLRLGSKRTNSIIDRIRVLGNCANPYAYEYTDEDIKKIFGAIEQELKLARAKFMNHKRREFKLD